MRFRSSLRRALGTARPIQEAATSPGPQPDPFADLESLWSVEPREPGEPYSCNLCGWSGEAFSGGWHSESAQCPTCGSVARDRFLLFCMVKTLSPDRYRVLETSPRLGAAYRSAMARWFDYLASDFDLRGHRAEVRIDLQDIALDDASIDLLLTPHVLEHVPDTDRALAEIRRVLSPGGWMFLQVPVLQGTTARPIEPEFHGDRTPVEWRFGPDLTPRLRDHGFETSLLCTSGLLDIVTSGCPSWPDPVSPEFDVDSVLRALNPRDLRPVALRSETSRFGFHPSYMFLTWACRRPADDWTDPAPR